VAGGDDPDVPATDTLAARAPQPLPETLRLTVLSGADQGRTLQLTRGAYVIGKARDCALPLTDGAVSRHHLRLDVRADGILVSDLGSHNGSFFQGARFREVTVGVGAIILIGATELKIATVESAGRILPSSSDRFGALLGRSLAMRELFALLERVAPTDANVLVEGETGTGKELCARALHARSGRVGGPFVICDLAALSRSLIESELFGHKRGAFTGADRDRDGCFVLAEGGTIFIDEIGELELDVQPRLLRVLQQRAVKPVGASSYRDVDVRVIAATNRDLRAECAAGRFRDDLFHRLAVVRARLPPLRERKEDLAPLVEHLLAGRGLSVPVETLALLTEYDWPGNVRELENVLEHGTSLVGDGRALTPELLGLEPPSSRSPRRDAPDAHEGFREAKERLIAGWERSYLIDLLHRSGGNVSEAARCCGLARPNLHRLLRKHGLGPLDHGSDGTP